MWKPAKEVVVVTSKAQRDEYLKGEGPLEQWRYRRGRHKQDGEFPVMLVRHLLLSQGYDVYVSGLSKLELPCYALAMFPGQSADAAFTNSQRVLALSPHSTRRFLEGVKKHKQRKQLTAHGGDPDLLVQHRRDPGDCFFVEVKAESESHTDDLNDQQRAVFPLIEKYLKRPIVLARVHILGGQSNRRQRRIWQAG